jgi:23S rRNA G2445 N2-methylase RlmL
MAQAYPTIHVDGYDLDEPSIEMARDNAREARLNGRVSFFARDAGDINNAGHTTLSPPSSAFMIYPILWVYCGQCAN